jgi:hypothetical protein
MRAGRVAGKTGPPARHDHFPLLATSAHTAHREQLVRPSGALTERRTAASSEAATMASMSVLLP